MANLLKAINSLYTHIIKIVQIYNIIYNSYTSFKICNNANVVRKMIKKLIQNK